MDRLDYAQGVVMARVYEKRLLDKGKLDKMIDAKDADEAFKILLDSEYIKSSEGVDGVKNYELLLKNETARAFKLGAEMLNDKRILEILSLKYDYHNLKVIVKGKVSGKNFDDLFIYSSDNNPDKIRVQFESGHFTNTKSEFIKALRSGEAIFEETNDPQMIDIVIDRAYYSHLKDVSDSLAINLFSEYVSSSIDFFNISSMLRAVKMGKSQSFLSQILVEGGGVSVARLISLSREDFDRVAMALKSEKVGRALLECVDEYKEKGSLGVIDNMKDIFLSRLNSDSRFISFGPEPIFAYLVAKEKEISIIRLILVGKLNNIPSTKLRERLGGI
ncbi:V-type ATP synthase subunit C [Peptostreptococcus sp. D1]|uniref:V-type ATP synthase subunit C n=1 Tax=Peptostreptococcus sp. D1 TaxID=72304 RepID=UPI0008EC192D|nr:V-type ATP synthase subunit C [Peptostreptococcus sp. D1]SFE94846.1 V/A-type H+-transporting ATPase subunit C [Peptostreptococcus sp. D1]